MYARIIRIKKMNFTKSKDIFKKTILSILLLNLVMHSLVVIFHDNWGLPREGVLGFQYGLGISIFLIILKFLVQFLTTKANYYQQIQIQFYILGMSSLVNITSLFYFAFLKNNIPFVLGFFIANYLNLKIFVFANIYINRHGYHE
jgi:hypothetical protein